MAGGSNQVTLANASEMLFVINFCLQQFVWGCACVSSTKEFNFFLSIHPNILVSSQLLPFSPTIFSAEEVLNSAWYIFWNFVSVHCTRMANFKKVWFVPSFEVVEKFGILNYWKFAGVIYLTNSMYVCFAYLSRTVSGWENSRCLWWYSYISDWAFPQSVAKKTKKKIIFQNNVSICTVSGLSGLPWRWDWGTS